ncbi:chemotaxis response regulator protein-glutamate methylesterase [Collimonas sp. OK412]|jgi:two-component system chemotaxis response regulator CheB/two-component system response regulator WspF|uniref:chemotaxis response regulator protein-glutamate methylesterase n=1 Tax=Collimonas sp. (strain OK412) TaxID=1801619 RepID=UPI0008EE3082|nr:chemotaxis response regulator protein-glutamate methylesterase [Collimonas sp. OK412]SFB92142.1 two-component system, chemotaxis family, response regulator WspF [Collimonas sp. OK412]
MKIGIVNDAPIAVEALRRTLVQRQDHEIIWIAEDGQRAIELCAWQVPDLILMDLMMPVLDGVAATRHIMAHTPCAILIVTGDVGANVSAVYDAMAYGALDAIDTPSTLSGYPRNDVNSLLAKIDSIEKLLNQRQSLPEQGAPAAASAAATAIAAGGRKSSLPAPDSKYLVAIGASAGGPAALATLLSQLPADFPAALVVVQHVDAQFASGMAEWLSSQSKLPVRLALAGDSPAPGQVLLAGTDDHLRLTRPFQLGYTEQPSGYPYRPSIDVFFQSIVELWAGKAIGILLTGMGRDGALGLKAMRDKGYYTIAQDRQSSAVYGMPKAAALLDAADAILPVNQIAGKLAGIISKR